MLVEDGAEPHTHHYLAALRDGDGVVQEDWPSSSPDLNAIEPVWQHMKNKIAAYRPKIKKVKELRSVLAKEWKALPQEKINSLIESMPARIKACIKDKGGNNYNY